MYTKYITYQQEVIFMLEGTCRNRGKGIWVRLSVLVITVISLFVFTACRENITTNPGGNILSVERSTVKAGTPQQPTAPPTDTNRSDKDEQINTDGNQDDHADYYRPDPNYVEVVDCQAVPVDINQDDNTANSTDYTDSQTNDTTNPVIPGDTHADVTYNQPNADQTNNTYNNVTGVELTFLQQTIFDMFVEMVSVPGQIFIARLPGISPTQKTIGADQASGIQMFTQNTDGTRTGSTGFITPVMRLIAFSHETALTEFSSGVRRITEGRLPQAAGEAMISREFADLNGLSVGGTVEFLSFDLSVTDIMRLTVVGIYHDGTPEFPALGGGFMRTVSNPVDNRRNEVITHFDTLFNHPQFVVASHIDSRPAN
jgi:hypothetical protein